MNLDQHHAAGYGLGINPDAFGVWEPNVPGDPTWEQFLDGAALAGYSMIELGPYGYLPTDTSHLADELQARSLGLTGGYVAGVFHDPSQRRQTFEEVHAVARTTAGAGAEYLLLLARTSFGPQGRLALDGDDWKEMISGLMEAERIATGEYGLKVVYHPHVGLAVETEAETRKLVEDGQGRLAICLDTGQFSYPGGDPAAFIREFGALIAYLHLRDLDAPVRDRCVRDGVDFYHAALDGVFCEPGEGSVDFGDISNAVRTVGFDGPIVVERSLLGATVKDATDAARRAFVFYRSAGFGSCLR